MLGPQPLADEVIRPTLLYGNEKNQFVVRPHARNSPTRYKEKNIAPRDRPSETTIFRLRRAPHGRRETSREKHAVLVKTSTNDSEKKPFMSVQT